MKANKIMTNFGRIGEILVLSIVGSLTIAGSSFSGSSATLENLTMCGKITADKQCASYLQ
jgi:hypothetical protein